MQTLTYNYDMQTGILAQTEIPPFLVTGDKNAHTIEVGLTKNGKTASLSGYTCSAYVVRADGVTVSLTGTISGNKASVTLTSNCYNVAGRLAIIVRLSTSTEIVTVFYGLGAVLTSSTDSVIDPENVIPSLEDLLAQIAAMEAATSKATTAAGNAQTVADTVTEKLNKGEFTGKGLTILGYYDTLAALKSAVPSPAVGDCYGVGSASPYDIYTWDGVAKSWRNNGAIGSTGIPTGGTAGQVLKKASDADNDTEWSNETVTSVNGQTGAVTVDIPVTSVNGQTGAVVIDIPSSSGTGTPVITSFPESSFTNTVNQAVTLYEATVTEAGWYLFHFNIRFATTFTTRTFVNFLYNTIEVPANTPYPAVEIISIGKCAVNTNYLLTFSSSQSGTVKYEGIRKTVVKLCD